MTSNFTSRDNGHQILIKGQTHTCITSSITRIPACRIRGNVDSQVGNNPHSRQPFAQTPSASQGLLCHSLRSKHFLSGATSRFLVNIFEFPNRLWPSHLKPPCISLTVFSDMPIQLPLLRTGLDINPDSSVDTVSQSSLAKSNRCSLLQIWDPLSLLFH